MASLAAGDGADAARFVVAIRCRPLSEREAERQAQPSVVVQERKLVTVLDPGHFATNIMRQARDVRPRRFAFDYAFDEATPTADIHAAVTRRLIDGVVAGFNSTAFAYGPTGTGKTFSMLGAASMPGLMVLVLRDLYAALRRRGGVASTRLSYIEIYNESIRDLLMAPDAAAAGGAAGGGGGGDDAAGGGASLDIREDPIRGMCVAGVSEHAVGDADDAMALLVAGNRRRTQEPTAANRESSRSHAVLQIVVQATDAGGREMKIGKLSMCDLAGSERASNTQNRGQRLLEGANINRSLLALGNCITALVAGKGSFVPYRDSKLTRLLKDSLGGATRTVMLGCISPAAAAFEETVNTLKYCDRAKQIRVDEGAAPPLPNVVRVNHAVTEYEALITGLRGEVAALRSKLAAGVVPSPQLAPAQGSGRAGAPARGSDRTPSPARGRADGGRGGAAALRLPPLSHAVSVNSSSSQRPATADAATALRAGAGAAGGGGTGAREALRESLGLGRHGSVGQQLLDAAAAAAASAQPATAAEISRLREALVTNYQERMQLRRSLAELAAQNVENDAEIARRSARIARWGTAGAAARPPLSGAAPGARGRESTGGDVAAERREVARLQAASAANAKTKASLAARLDDNEAAGGDVRTRLEALCGASGGGREVLTLEYRVHVLELEKVELESGRLLVQRMLKQRDAEARKLQRQVAARDAALAQAAALLAAHGLSLSDDLSRIAALDEELAGAGDDYDDDDDGGGGSVPPSAAALGSGAAPRSTWAAAAAIAPHADVVPTTTTVAAAPPPRSVANKKLPLPPSATALGRTAAIPSVDEIAGAIGSAAASGSGSGSGSAPAQPAAARAAPVAVAVSVQAAAAPPGPMAAALHRVNSRSQQQMQALAAGAAVAAPKATSVTAAAAPPPSRAVAASAIAHAAAPASSTTGGGSAPTAILANRGVAAQAASATVSASPAAGGGEWRTVTYRHRNSTGGSERRLDLLPPPVHAPPPPALPQVVAVAAPAGGDNDETASPTGVVSSDGGRSSSCSTASSPDSASSPAQFRRISNLLSPQRMAAAPLHGGGQRPLPAAAAATQPLPAGSSPPPPAPPLSLGPSVTATVSGGSTSSGGAPVALAGGGSVGVGSGIARGVRRRSPAPPTGAVATASPAAPRAGVLGPREVQAGAGAGAAAIATVSGPRRAGAGAAPVVRGAGHVVSPYALPVAVKGGGVRLPASPAQSSASHAAGGVTPVRSLHR